MLDLTQIDLGRMRGKELSSLSRWLNNADAIHSFEAAVAGQLKRIRLATKVDIDGVYTFGREMRNVFDGRGDQNLQFSLNPGRIPPKIFLIFMAGFLRQPYEYAAQIFDQSKEDLDRLVEVIFRSNNGGNF